MSNWWAPFQDPKRKIHKPVKATLRLEIERLYSDDHEQDSISECGSFSNGSTDGDTRSTGAASLSGRSSQGLGFTKAMYNGRQKWSPVEKHRYVHSASGSSIELGRSEVCETDVITASSQCHFQWHVLLCWSFLCLHLSSTSIILFTSVAHETFLMMLHFLFCSSLLHHILASVDKGVMSPSFTWEVNGGVPYFWFSQQAITCSHFWSSNKNTSLMGIWILQLLLRW